MSAALTASVSIAGFLLAMGFVWGALNLETQQRVLADTRIHTAEVKHLTDTTRQWMLLNDLVYGSGQTYLVDGALGAGTLLLEQIENLSRAGEFAGMEELLAAIRDNQTRLSGLYGLTDGGSREPDLLGQWDVTAELVYRAVDSWAQQANDLNAVGQLDFAQFRRNLILLGVFAVVIYLLICVGVARWMRARIAHPLINLSEAARQAQEAGKPFELDAQGPLEVRQLIEKFSAFASQLEELVQSRTRELIDEVSERRLAEEAAEQANVAKSEFLASMSHEIRTPLNGMLGGIQLARVHETDPEQCANLDIALRSGEQLLDILNDVLEFSKLEAGKIELLDEQFNPREVFSDIGRMFAARAAELGIELILDVDPQLPGMLRGDPLRLRQIVSNLVGNAVKFTHAGQVIVRVEIQSSVSADEAALRIAVEDTGVGIPDDKLAGLFDAFSQVNASTTRRFGGTGLGLSIVKQFVDLLGGRYGVESEIGVGSTFWVQMSYHVADSTRVANGIAADKRVWLGIEQPALRTALERIITAWQLSLCSDPQDADLRIVDTQSYAGGQGGTTETILLKPVDASPEAELPPHVQCLITPVIDQDLARIFTDVREVSKPSVAEVFDLDVLVVDDNPVNRMVAKGMLQKMGCHVEQACDGQEAVDVVTARGKPHDLVLMDWHMPDLDGIEATQRIRLWEQENAKVEQNHIVALTANAFNQDREACLAAGMNGFLAKPIKFDEIKAVLQAVDRT